MAHFLEHMLFLGTEKYPRVGEFQTFINQSGGSNNAWTGTENTTYFFEVSPHTFSEGLDRFGQFFTAPLFNEDAVDKERNAVDSEYKLKLRDDVRRLYQVHKETVNPSAPGSPNFRSGDITTLEDRQNKPVRTELMKVLSATLLCQSDGAGAAGPRNLWMSWHLLPTPISVTSPITWPTKNTDPGATGDRQRKSPVHCH